MIDRYQDRDIASLFSDGFRYELWREIEVEYLFIRASLHDPMVTPDVIREISRTASPLPGKVMKYEMDLGHDVVAFLAAWTSDMSAAAASQVHYGLTSSDLVDNAMYRQVLLAGRHVHSLASDLHKVVHNLAVEFKDTKRAGRTHGQKAEVTTLGWRFRVWEDTLEMLVDEWIIMIEPDLNVLKTPGAVGNMQILGDAVAVGVARHRAAKLVASTQVIPRQRLAAWAGWCLRLISVCEEIALEIRLSSRTEVQEMLEGAAPDRVGSSAMPHKRNPIGSEQISGLARVARANFMAIMETAGALHNERDISNSSVERIVVPDLAHITTYILDRMAKLLLELRVDQGQMSKGARYLNSSRVLADLQRMGMPYMQAMGATRNWVENMGWDYEAVLSQFEALGKKMTINEFLRNLTDRVDLGPSKRWGNP